MGYTEKEDLFTQLVSGTQFFPWRPTPEMIKIRDIVWALPRLNRYLGHTSYQAYTVAQHSCLMAKLIEPEYKFEALMHDAAEAYIGDLPYPIKVAMPSFRELEDNIWEKAIAPRFKLASELHPEVKTLDRNMIEIEYHFFASDCIKQSGVKWDFHKAGRKYPWQQIQKFWELQKLAWDEQTSRKNFDNMFCLLYPTHQEAITSSGKYLSDGYKEYMRSWYEDLQTYQKSFIHTEI